MNTKFSSMDPQINVKVNKLINAILIQAAPGAKALLFHHPATLRQMLDHSQLLSLTAITFQLKKKLRLNPKSHSSCQSSAMDKAIDSEVNVDIMDGDITRSTTAAH